MILRVNCSSTVGGGRGGEREGEREREQEREVVRGKGY